MTNAEIRIVARDMVKLGQAASMMEATRQITSRINAEALAAWRTTLPAEDR